MEKAPKKRRVVRGSKRVLERLITEHNLRQEDVAAACKVKQPRVSRYLRGDTMSLVAAENLIKFAKKKYNQTITLDELFVVGKSSAAA